MAKICECVDLGRGRLLKVLGDSVLRDGLAVSERLFLLLLSFLPAFAKTVRSEASRLGRSGGSDKIFFVGLGNCR